MKREIKDMIVINTIKENNGKYNSVELASKFEKYTDTDIRIIIKNYNDDINSLDLIVYKKNKYWVITDKKEISDYYENLEMKYLNLFKETKDKKIAKLNAIDNSIDNVFELEEEDCYSMEELIELYAEEGKDPDYAMDDERLCDD